MDLKLLKELENKVSWLSNYIIHNANHLRKKNDDLKVGTSGFLCISSIDFSGSVFFKILNKMIELQSNLMPVQSFMLFNIY